jgi:hypothetical protein
MGVDVGIAYVLFASGVVLDVEELGVVIIGMPDAVLVIAGVPRSLLEIVDGLRRSSRL